MSDILDRLAGRRVVASVSGGKDSAAMSLWLTEQGVVHDRVFLDTGWEHELTYEYLRGPLTQAIGPIQEISGARKMADLIRHKGMFPSRRRRFCTEELKVFPMQRYIRALVDAGEDCVNTVGIRAAESDSRAKMPEWEYSEGFDCEVWRPLLRWTTEDVIAIHQRHNLRPNPLYFKGASRVGCWPCIFSRKSEVRLVADLTPDRIDDIRNLEGDVAVKVTARRSQRLVVFQQGGAAALTKPDRAVLLDDEGNVKPFHAPVWFQAPIGPSGECWPIDRVVEWSRTVRGGREEDRQVELFAQADEGCMRWGMCDTAPEED